MPSTATLTTLRARVQAFLVDTGAAVWTTGTLDEAIRLALMELSRTRPAEMNQTLAYSAREISLSLSGFLNMERVVYPYDSSNPAHPMKFVKWFLVWNLGSPKLYLDIPDAPDSSKNLRLFYYRNQVLNALDGGTTTTFSEEEESLLVVGAAGYACYQRAIDLNEDPTQNALAVPNYGELAERLLKEFRRQLPRGSRGADV